MSQFDSTQERRSQLWHDVVERLESFYDQSERRRVTPVLNRSAILDHLHHVGLDGHNEMGHIVQLTIDVLEKNMVHITHPMYYGLFNPRPTFPSILGDLIAAVMNPQMAAWSHAPFAAECENYLIKELGVKFGWKESNVDGTFCTGGAESNLTAVLCALCHRFPEVIETGVMGLSARPIIYTSSHSHDSVARAARVTGLGVRSVRVVDTDDQLALKPEHLKLCIEDDRAQGLIPLMVVGTVGTTGPGSIDPLEEIGQIASDYKLWFHVDGAYGAALALHDNYKNEIRGINKADSITCDIHKWLSVPMGASVFLTSDGPILKKTFRIDATYMPKEGAADDITDPFAHSIQWSRRFIGLKCYLTFAVFGWQGLSDMINQTCEVGRYLKSELENNNWNLGNTTPMPIACFYDSSLTNEQHQQLCNAICEGGQAWISTYPIKGQLTLRACITNYQTQKHHVDRLLVLVNAEREKLLQ